MKLDTVSTKLIAIALISGVCLIASLLVVVIVEEREGRAREAAADIAASWSAQQTVAGPILVAARPSTPSAVIDESERIYVLPKSLHVEAVVEPELRARGIFSSAVYTSEITLSGTFDASEVQRALPRGTRSVDIALAITDTRGVEQPFSLTWQDREYSFLPGAAIPLREGSGLHVAVPLPAVSGELPFSLTFRLKGSGGIAFAPVGSETTINLSSPWPTPKFVGAFLPSEHTLHDHAFSAEWHIASFGRPYPQSWEGDELYLPSLSSTVAGVELHVAVDAYDMVSRSAKYAILFIVTTFAAFFLFDVLASVRVHPIQYLMVGASLALFYLLLLSLSEQIGFLYAYLIAGAMIVGLVSAYSYTVLKNVRRVAPVSLLLLVLYGYLYFVLRLEDLALLFGSLLLFVLLATVMFMTRSIDWFAVGKTE